MLKVDVRTEGSALVFIDPDGDEHVCHSPAEAWGLLQDLVGQVQEQQALAVRQPEPRRSRRERMRAAAGNDDDSSTAMARPARATAPAQRTAPVEPPPPPPPEDAPEEEHDLFARAFGRIGAWGVQKAGEVSSTTKHTSRSARGFKNS